jgi:hypothetical protein
MYVYTAYNLCIHSQIPLPELVTCEGSSDVIVRLGNLSSIAPATIDQGNYCYGRVEGVGIFLIQDGQEIVIDPIPGVDESILRPCLLGPALAVLLRQRGLLVLHASSIAVKDGAVAFIGGSGWGKSTLAQAFHAKGYSILTDDVMGIKMGAAHPVVLPGFPQVKLWPEAAASIEHVPERLPLLHPQTQKLAHYLTGGFCQTPLPLKRIYVLAVGTHHAIATLQPQAAFVEIVRHSRAAISLTDPDFVSSHLRHCASLVKQVPICRFQRQPSLAALPELVQLVEEDLAQAVCHDAGSRHSLEPCFGSLSSAN